MVAIRQKPLGLRIVRRWFGPAVLCIKSWSSTFQTIAYFDLNIHDTAFPFKHIWKQSKVKSAYKTVTSVLFLYGSIDINMIGSKFLVHKNKNICCSPRVLNVILPFYITLLYSAWPDDLYMNPNRKDLGLCLFVCLFFPRWTQYTFNFKDVDISCTVTNFCKNTVAATRIRTPVGENNIDRDCMGRGVTNGGRQDPPPPRHTKMGRKAKHKKSKKN